MRKQYHFWPSDRGLQAWGVDRLIALSSALPLVEIDPNTIAEIDQVYWFDVNGFDGKSERPTCRKVLDHMRLIEQADLSYPIILAADGRVMDGMHRVAKALLEARTAIEARRFSEDPPPDYVGKEPSELPY